jgi:hypothetical protein
MRYITVEFIQIKQKGQSNTDYCFVLYLFLIIYQRTYVCFGNTNRFREIPFTIDNDIRIYF